MIFKHKPTFCRFRLLWEDFLCVLVFELRFRCFFIVLLQTLPTQPQVSIVTLSLQLSIDFQIPCLTLKPSAIRNLLPRHTSILYMYTPLQLGTHI